MRGYNKVIIMGNFARDPEVRYTATQQAVASFTVACNRSVKQQDGTFKEVADFINVVVWGKTAEMVSRYFKKGSGIHVDGRLSTRSYEDKTGQKKYVTEVVAENILFAGGDRQQASAHVAPAPTPAPAARPAPAFNPNEPVTMDMNMGEEIPF